MKVSSLLTAVLFSTLLLMSEGVSLAQVLYVGSNTAGNSTNFTNGYNSYSSILVGYAPYASNNQLNIGNASTHFSAGYVYIGVNGSSNSLIITNGATVMDQTGEIGLSQNSSNNSVLVSGHGTVWGNNYQLVVGEQGSINRLVISNGSTVADQYGVLGNTWSASNNSALITGIGSIWSNASSLAIGAQGSGSSLTISNGGKVVDGNAIIGNSVISSNNAVLVTGINSLWTNSGDLRIGNGSSGFGPGSSRNTLMIANGGTVVDTNGVIGNGSSSNNTVLVSGTNALWTNSGNLTVGDTGFGNSMTISNGGKVVDGSATIGISASGNQVLVTGSGSLWSNSSRLIVGNWNSNSLVISNGGRVIDSIGSIGESAFASNNSALVTGNGSVWSNTAALYVGGVSGTGEGGKFSSLVISNGGQVVDADARIGPGGHSSGNQVVVTGSNSVWNNTLVGYNSSNSLIIGNSSVSNSLVISNGGRVLDQTGNIGLGSGAVGNQAVVTGAGSLWSNSGNLLLGSNGFGNSLTISNGGKVVDVTGTIGYTNSPGNTALVTGTNSLWSNSGSLYIGYNNSGGNSLTISNAGMVSDSNATIGYANSSNNSVLVTGNGSFWSNSASLTLGYNGSGNSLIISNGGRVIDAGFQTIIGASNTASNNSILVTGSGSTLTNARFLSVGLSGAGNALVVNDGGQVFAMDTGVGTSSNRVVVTGQGSLLSNAASFELGDGSGGSGNSLVVSNRGAVLGGSLSVGNGSLFVSNSVVVMGAGSVLSNSFGLYLGDGGSGNTLTIRDGGQAYARSAWVGITSTGSNNTVLIADRGSLLSNSESFALGNGGQGNSMVISNAGVVANGVGIIGSNSAGNTVLVTGNGSLWSNSGELLVGVSGSGNTLVISNGGTVMSASGTVGWQSGANSNRVIVTVGNPFFRGNSFFNTSAWSNSGTLSIGQGGSGNSLVISNGGTVMSESGAVGGEWGANSNTVIVSGGNPFAGDHFVGSTLWSNSGTLSIGQGGSGNSMVISNGGTVISANGIVGEQAGANSNRVIVAGGSLPTITFLQTPSSSVILGGGTNSILFTPVFLDGQPSQWSNSGTLSIGQGGSGNSLVISNGSTVISSNGIVGEQAGANSNRVIISGWNFFAGDIYFGRYTLWSNSGALTIGQGGSGNSLVISNGAQVKNSNGYIGARINSSNNSVMVTGVGSLWSNSGDLIVGNTGYGNSLVISNGGTVSSSYSQHGAVIGFNAGSSNNSILVTGPQSLMSNALGTIVGNDGSGNSLGISNSGVVSSGYGVIGQNSNSSNNSVTVSGSGSLWTNINTLTIGSAGSGTLTVANNATVAASTITIAAQSGSSGTLNVGSLGGSDNAGFINTSTINFGAGTGTINLNQSDVVSIASTISSGVVESTRIVPVQTTNGTVYKMVNLFQETVPGTIAVNQLGLGTTILTASNSYAGTTTISTGTLQANNGSALGTSTVILNGGTLAVNSLLTIASLNWNTTNSNIAINKPGKNFLNVTGGITLGVIPKIDTNTVFNFSFFNYTLSGTPTELLYFGTNALRASEFGINNLSNYLLFTSNNALWIRQYALIATNNISTVTGTNSYSQLSFQPGGVLSITPKGNLTITGGVNVTNNGVVTLNGTLNTPFVYVASGGTLGGSGLLNGNLTNGGLLSPGNSPGTLTVKGNFTQTGSGNLLIQIASPSDFDQVIVSGKALLGGRLIVTPYNGYQFAFGQKFGFLTASSIKGSFSQIEAPYGYRARLTIVGDPVAYINIAPASYTQLAASPNQYQVAKALDSFIPATSGDQLVVSTTLDSLSAAQYQSAFNAIAPTLYQSESTIAFNLANAQNQELLQRLWGVRLAGTGFSMSGLAENTFTPQETEGKGVLDSKKDILRSGLDNHWGMFVDGNGIFAVANSGNMLPNYNSQSGGVTTGLTYKWNDSFGTGIYAGYEGSYAKYSGGSSLIDNSVRFGLFGTYGNPNANDWSKGLYADGLIGGGYNNYQVSRNISFNGLSRTASSTPGAGELDSMLAGGYDLKKGNWTYGPTTSLQYTYFGANAVNETGAQSLDFNSSGWNTSSLLYSLGAHVAYSWQANKDILVVPQISLSWQHEFLQSPYSINGSMGGSPTFSNTSSTPLRDTLYTGVGFTVELYKKWNTSLFYNASAGNSDLTSQNIFWSAGLKF